MVSPILSIHIYATTPSKAFFFFLHSLVDFQWRLLMLSRHTICIEYLAFDDIRLPNWFSFVSLFKSGNNLSIHHRRGTCPPLCQIPDLPSHSCMYTFLLLLVYLSVLQKSISLPFVKHTSDVISFPSNRWRTRPNCPRMPSWSLTLEQVCRLYGHNLAISNNGNRSVVVLRGEQDPNFVLLVTK